MRILRPGDIGTELLLAGKQLTVSVSGGSAIVEVRHNTKTIENSAVNSESMSFGDYAFDVSVKISSVSGITKYSDESIFIEKTSTEKLVKINLPDIKLSQITDQITVPVVYPGIGDEAITHPQIEYSATRFNGYKYWMVYTPYPFISGTPDSAYENPCIVASNDLARWDQPATNPIVLSPSGTAFNSDVSLAFNEDETILYLIYRERSATINSLKMMHTTDGVKWSTPVDLMTGSTSTQDFATPSIWYNPQISKWEAVFINGDAGVSPLPVQKSTSDNDNPYSAWGSPITLNITPSGVNTFWNAHFVRDKNGSVFGVLSEPEAAPSEGLFALFSSPNFMDFTRHDLGGALKVYRPSIYFDESGNTAFLLSKLQIPYFINATSISTDQFDELAADKTDRLTGKKYAIIRDSFIRADSTVTLGNAENGLVWNVSGGAGGISTNRAYNVSTSNTRFLAQTSAADGEIEMVIETAAAGGSWIICRAQDTANYLRIGIVNNTTDQITFQDITDGGVARAVLSPFLDIDYTAEIKLGVVMKGNSFEIFLNRIKVFVVTEEHFSDKAQHGIQLAGTAGYIDSFLFIGG